MWFRTDSINLNGSISFYEQAHALEALYLIKSMYDKKFEVEHAAEKGKDIWVIDLTTTQVDPRFMKTIVILGEKFRSEGTVTYAYNERLETGIWRNGDFTKMRPFNLLDFAIEKLGMREDDITEKDYARIKQEWLFRVWNIR